MRGQRWEVRGERSEGRREKGKKGGGKEGGGKGYRTKQEDPADLPVLMTRNCSVFSLCYFTKLLHGNFLRIVASSSTDDVDTTIIYRRLNSLTRLDIVRGNSLTIDVDDAHICLPLER